MTGPSNQCQQYVLVSQVKKVNREPSFTSRADFQRECHVSSDAGEFLLVKHVNKADKVKQYLLASLVSQVKKAKTRKPASQVKPVLLATLGSLWKGI
jgi:hypothetical protein